MQTAGIVCECNPFHGGHRHLIEQAKKSGADAVICVMSGCFTQRGEPAILPPGARARMLLAGGANAILELPFPVSSSGAEFFAFAGVSVLDRLGVDELWFGSECGDVALLRRAAEITLRTDFADHYRRHCADPAKGTAQAYADCLTELGNIPQLSPNDILGVSYLRALILRGSGMLPKTILRLGNAFHDRELRDDCLPSATALRRLLKARGVDAWENRIEPEQLRIVKKSIAAKEAPAFPEYAERAILSFFRLVSPDLLERTPELGGGLGRRLAAAADLSHTLQELLANTITKKYTESRVLRGILFAMTGVTQEDIRREPAYAVLLGADKTGCAFLAQRRKTSGIPVVTSHAGIPQTPDARRQEELTRKAFALYSLCLPETLPTGYFLRASSQITQN